MILFHIISIQFADNAKPMPRRMRSRCQYYSAKSMSTRMRSRCQDECEAYVKKNAKPMSRYLEVEPESA